VVKKDQLTNEFNAHFIGPVLKEARVVRLINTRSGKEEKKIEAMEVRSIEVLDSADIPAETFAAPTLKPSAPKKWNRKPQRC
jgi:hypothetical protein